MKPSSKGNARFSVIAKSQEKAKVLKVEKPVSAIKPKPSSTIIQKPIPKPIMKIEKPSIVAQMIKQKGKVPNVSNVKINNLPFHIFDGITVFIISNVVDVMKLSHVCRNWRQHFYREDGPYLWRLLKDNEKLNNMKEMKIAWKERWVQQISVNFQNHQKLFCRLFQYGSTKENIANKLIKKLNLDISLKINKLNIKSVPFAIKTYNFSSYLTAKVPQISELEFDFTTPHNMFKDKIQLELTLFSRTFAFKQVIKKTYLPQDIYQKAIRQKAFNYYIDKNFIITFFQGDKNFLYLFMEFSLLDIINGFRNSMKQNKDKLPIPPKSIKIWKQLSQTKFQNFVEYFKYQADFQLHFSFHNSLKQIFTHCDTKVYPVEYNNKSAFFSFKIKDSFAKQPTYKLDNKMGMSESVPNLFLLDLIMKDRDRFVITFSGFIYVKTLNAEEKTRLDGYMSFQNYPVISLSYVQPNYSFQLIIVDEGSKYFVPSMTMELRSSIMNTFV